MIFYHGLNRMARASNPCIKLHWLLFILSAFLSSSFVIYLLVDSGYVGSKPLPVFQDVHLIILIPSAAKNVLERNAIRNTWLKKGGLDFKHFFFIGGKWDESLDFEAKINGDIVFLPVGDGYGDLTQKVLAAFVHLDKNYHFKFVLKCDDDSYARIPDILSELKGKYDGTDDLYWGYFHGSGNVKRRGKWKEENWILCDYYLPHALGGGYVLSRKLVNFIAKNADILIPFKTEDVSVGTWLAPLKVTRVHDIRFDTEYKTRGCSNMHLITHKVSPEGMFVFEQNFKSLGKLCREESKVMNSYIYDWTVPPSKCCRRTKVPIS